MHLSLSLRNEAPEILEALDENAYATHHAGW